MEKRRKQVLAASFLAGAFAVTAGFAVQGHARAAQYRRMLDNTYQHAFTELATAAGELDVALRKVTYATVPSCSPHCAPRPTARRWPLSRLWASCPTAT